MTVAKKSARKAAATRGIEAQAQQSLKHLKAALKAASKRPEKEGSIHDLRVSIRRFKQTLRVYSDFIAHTRKMRRSLRGLMDLCGEARNCDVALTVLEAAGVPAHGPVKSALAKRRADAARKLAGELRGWHIRSHVRRWRHWLTVKAEGQSAAPAAPELSREFRTTGAAPAQAEASYRQMHRFRLLVKKTRYASEILDAPEIQVEALRALQDRLGEVNDCVTTGELIADLKLDAAKQRPIRAALNRLAEKRAEEFRVFWREHYGRKGFAARKRIAK